MKYCIVFAAPVGAGKSTIAHYLSWNLNLPIYSVDFLRAKIRADLNVNELNPDIVKEERDKDIGQILDSKISFILDASVDRGWTKLKSKLVQEGYKHFVVSLDVTKSFLNNLTALRGDKFSADDVDKWFNDHQEFMKLFTPDVNLSINNENYPNRLCIVLDSVRSWLETEQ